MAAVLKIPGTTITGIPIPPIDPRLSVGSLLLVDPTHPTRPYTGSLASGSLVPNIAAAEAKALVGAPVDAVSIFTAADPKHATVTRTKQGRLHFTSSITVDEAGDRAGLSASALRDYLLANTGHRFYFSAALVPTRVKAPTGASTNQVAGVFRSTDFGSGLVSVGWTPAGAPAALPGSSSPDRVGFTSKTAGAEMFTAVTAAALGLTAVPTGYVAATGPWGGVANVHNTSSFVLGSLYLEDLTVSGRTHAQVAALDLEAFDFATQNRWTGDSWSAPLD